MAPSIKVKNAFKAMKALGITEAKTKPVLKKLLQLFDKNWNAIEEDNYRVLADAIFEDEEVETAEKKKQQPEISERGLEVAVSQDGPMQDEIMQDEFERPLKRLRLKHQAQGVGSNGQATSVGALKKPKSEHVEPDTSPSPRAITRSQSRNMGKHPVSSHNTKASAGSVEPSEKQSKTLKVYEKRKQPQMPVLLKPKDEPFTEDVVSIEPLAIVLPGCSNNRCPSKPANQVSSQNGQRSGTSDELDEGMGSLALTAQEKPLQVDDASEKPPAKLNIAASATGKVQISLTCNPVTEGVEMHTPDLEAILKEMNDRFLKTYQIKDPDFSLTKLMREVCDCVEERSKNGNVARGQEIQAISDNGGDITPLDSYLNGDRTLADNSNPLLAAASQEKHIQPERNAYEDNFSESNAIFEKNTQIVHPPVTSDVILASKSPEIHLLTEQPEREAIVELNRQTIVVAYPCDTSDVAVVGEMASLLAAASPEMLIQPEQNAYEDKFAESNAIVENNIQIVHPPVTSDFKLASKSPEIHLQSEQPEREAIVEMNLQTIVVANPCDTSDVAMGGEMSSLLAVASPEKHIQPEQNAYDDKFAESNAIVENNIQIVHPPVTSDFILASKSPEIHLQPEHPEKEAVVEMNLQTIVVAHPCDTSDVAMGGEMASLLASASPEKHIQLEQNAYEDKFAESDAIVENNIQIVHPPVTSDVILASKSPKIHLQPEQPEREANIEMNLQTIVVAHPYDTSDVTMGREMVKVSLEKCNCEFPPSFHYLKTNIISENADVKSSLAQFGDKDCCFSCHADCLSPPSSCNCVQRYGGECPYTTGSLVSQQFLDEYVSVIRNPQKHDFMYCKDCPLEQSKNEDLLDPCKGHLKRKIIKECYSICGCSQHCGNRVVQQGLSCNMQVFWTPDGKGWGLRALENLPKGTFVCEYVGEILTIAELHKRNMSRSNDQHSYSVLLDSYWGTRALKEEEFLCLDATYYGNVARFINHRCTDANLIEIPVEIETPNLHYYHLALFTTRDVNAFEELTWDYGLDFDDHEQHIKTFRCVCGSQFCRNMKRPSRARLALTLQ